MTFHWVFSSKDHPLWRDRPLQKIIPPNPAFYFEHKFELNYRHLRRTDALSICRNQKGTLLGIKKFKTEDLTLWKLALNACLYLCLQSATSDIQECGISYFELGTRIHHIAIKLRILVFRSAYIWCYRLKILSITDLPYSYYSRAENHDSVIPRTGDSKPTPGHHYGNRLLKAH